jgi:hypothetical protein
MILKAPVIALAVISLLCVSIWGSSFAGTGDDVARTLPGDTRSAVLQLDETLSSDRKEQIRELEESELSREHFGLGGFVRNEWLYAPSSPLRAHFRQAGVLHDDHMSSIVLKAYWLHLRGQPVSEQELVEEYKESVASFGSPFGAPCPDHPETDLNTVFGDIMQGAEGQVQSRTWYAECPTTGSRWVFESPETGWRPANDAEQERFQAKKHIGRDTQ